MHSTSVLSGWRRLLAVAFALLVASAELPAPDVDEALPLVAGPFAACAVLLGDGAAVSGAAACEVGAASCCGGVACAAWPAAWPVASAACTADAAVFATASDVCDIEGEASAGAGSGGVVVLRPEEVGQQPFHRLVLRRT